MKNHSTLSTFLYNQTSVGSKPGNFLFQTNYNVTTPQVTVSSDYYRQKVNVWRTIYFCFAIFTLSYFSSLHNSYANKVVVAGPYTVNYSGITYTATTSTFSYTVKRTGPAQGNGLSHLTFSLGSCAKFTDVKSATIDGKPYTNLESSEGGGTGCDASGSILKFDNLPSQLSDGESHTFTFTLTGILEVTNNSTWVKAGRECYQAPISGPGCLRKCTLELELKKTNITCFGEKNGSVTAIASKEKGPLEFSLNGLAYQSSAVFSNLPEGEYTVSVREKDLITCSVSRKISISQPAPLTFSSSFDPIKCFNDKTTLNITTSGGTGSNQYSIDGGRTYQNSNEFEVGSGQYEIYVKDQNNCIAQNSLIINQPKAIQFTTGYKEIKCYGDKTTITIVATGGTGTFLYSINNGESYQNSNLFNNIGPGKYTICVKDANGCVKCEELQITEPNQLSLALSYNPVKCYGDKTSIIANAAGGSGELVYSINNGAFGSDKTFENVTAGEYTICVKDKNGCTTCQTITVEQPEKLKLSTSFEPVKCSGDNTSLLLSASGGSGSFSYSIDGGSAYQDENLFKNVLPGTYNVCTKDKNGCTVCETVVIEEPAKLQISAQYTPVTCFGGKSTLTITASGGSAPYHYSVNNGTYTSENTFENLVAGTYNINIKDKNGCVTNKEVQIEQPVELVLTTSYLPITCRGDKTTLTVTADGGTAPYMYSINGGTSYTSTNTFTNLASGDYNVCIKDKNGCIKCIVVCIAAPTAFAITTSYLPIKCYGDKTTLTVKASGGTGSLLYSLNGGTYQASNIFGNLVAGTYTVRIKDKNNCSKSVQVTIVQPKQILINTSYPVITCYGGKTNLTVTASNGTAPYMYALNGGTFVTGNVFKNLAAGNYNVSVKDAKGCVQTKTICITQPKLIVLTYSYPAISCYGGKTTLTITASGGTGTYQYSFNGGAYQTSNVFTNLPDGCYDVCVKDSKGCIQCKRIIIEPFKTTSLISVPVARMAVNEKEVAQSLNSLTIHPNPYVENARVEFTLQTESDYLLVVYDAKGTQVKQLGAGKAKAGQLYQFELDNTLPAGFYIVSLTTDKLKKTFRVTHQ